MIAHYKLFTTPTCPSCPAVKEHMKTVRMPGESIDATTPEGWSEAEKHGIRSVPTVLFFDQQGELAAVAQSVKQVQRVMAEHESGN